MSEPTGARRYGVGGGDAYYDAVKYGGYEGTREQFGRDQAEFAQNAAAVAEAKEAVEQDAEEVRSTKEEFGNTIVTNAIDAVQQEGADQVEAVTEKGEEVSQQVEAVGTQWKGEVANEGRSRVQAVEQAGTTQVQNVNDAGTTQVGNVNQAGEDQVDVVEQAGADQVQAVTDEGTTQVRAVQDEGGIQVQRVQDKGDEVLNSIPSDYTELTEDVDNLKESLNDIGENTVIRGTNLFDGNFDESGYFNANGDQSSTTYKRTSTYYEIPENVTKIYTYLSTIATVFSIGFYDSSKTWTGTKNVNNAITKENEIPANSKYFRVYTRTEWDGDCTLASSYVDSYIPYIEPTNKFVLNGAFKGKKIAFLGDSLIGNFNEYNGICNVLAKITDATIINCAFGGSRMAYEYSQYGDATPDATGYIDGATDAQKNQVDQYRYWNTLSGYGLAQAIASGDWSAQENAVANISSGMAYFSTRLAEIKAINWTTIDYILWEYGTNDFATRVKVSDVDNPTNYFAFDNAYRKTIETILTAYPNIKIIPITPMWRWWSNSGTFVDDSNTHTENDYSGTPRLLTSFVEAAKDVAKKNQLPCIDIYYTLGANKFNRLAFFNSTDGTHLNAAGRNAYANYLASQLNTLKAN